MILQGSIEDILEMVDTSNPLIIRVYDQVDTAVLLLKREEKIESLTIRGNSIFLLFRQPGGGGKAAEDAHRQWGARPVLFREQGSLESPCS